MENKPEIISKKQNPIALTSKQSIDRVQNVLTDILEGIPNSTILEKYSNEWNISQLSVYPYIQQATIEMSEWREKDRDTLIDDTYQKYNFLYRRAIRNGKQDKLALEILNNIVKLLGIQAPQQVQIDTTSRIININISPPDNDPF